MVKFPEKALAIRTCGADGTSHGGFKWPSEIGSVVTCDDWNAAAQCGNGLHALLDGFGDYALLSREHDAIWQVVEVSRAECIELDGKVKFESCTLIYSGLMAVAMTIMADYQTALMLNLRIDDPEASGYASRLAASGYASQLAASGKKSISVCVGLGGSALAGEDGCIALAWWDRNKQRYRLKVGYAGEDGIEAGETYELDAYNNFIQTN